MMPLNWALNIAMGAGLWIGYFYAEDPVIILLCFLAFLVPDVYQWLQKRKIT